MLNNAQVYGVSAGVSGSVAVIAVLIILRSGLTRNVKIVSSAGAVAACAVAFALSSYGVLKTRDQAADDDAGDDESYNFTLCTVDDNIGGISGATSSIESIGGTYLNYLASPVISPGCNPHIGLAPGSVCPATWARQDSITVKPGDCDVEGSTYTLDIKGALALVNN